MLVRLSKKLLDCLGGSIETKQLVQRFMGDATILFFMKFVGLLLGYLTALFMVRILGADNYGVFVFGIAFSNLLAVFGVFGMNTLTLREIVSGMVKSKFGHVRSVFLFSTLTVVGISLALIALTWVILEAFPTVLREEMKLAALIAACIVPFIALIRVSSGAVKALNHAITAMAPELIIRPLSFLLIMLGLWYFYPNFGPYIALWGQVATAACAAAFGYFFWLRKRTSDIPGSSLKMDDGKRWVGAGFSLLLVMSARTLSVQTDRIMLGLLGEPVDVGIYSVAMRNAQVTEIIIYSLDIAFASFIAEQFNRGNKQQTQEVITKLSRAVFSLTAIATVLFLLLAPFILGLFGPEFQKGQGVLTVLLLKYLLGVGMGSAGMILSMTGQEKQALGVLWGGALLNIILNLMLIPSFGMMGAAIATLISWIVWKSALTYNVLRNVGVDPTIVGKLHRIVEPGPKAVSWEDTR